jgi:ATP-grasp domain
MSILILNHASAFLYRYDEWLSHLDEELVLLTSSQKAKEFEGKGFKEVFYFENYESNGNVELKAIELFQRYKFNSIVAVGEYDLLRAGKLRDLLGIKGQTWKSANAFRDKVVMKEILKAQRIKVPEFKKISDAFDVIEFVQEHGYPVVIKPIDGAGSENTSVIRNEEELKQWLSHGIPFGMEVEKFIQGEMYHIDGLVLNGNLSFIWPSKYINGCLAYQEENYLGSYLLNQGHALFDRLVTYVENVLSILPTPENTAFHAEVFHTPDDKLILCEIASRIGGAKVNEVICQSFGIDLRKTMVQAQCDFYQDIHILEKPRLYSGWLLIPPKVGTFISGPTKPSYDWITEYRLRAKAGSVYGGAKRSIDNVASFVIAGNSDTEVEKRIDLAACWFENNSNWL